MKSFYSEEQFNIQGRGTVYMIQLEPYDKISVGEVILLDGEVKVISGLDSCNWKILREGGRTIAVSAKDVA